MSLATRFIPHSVDINTAGGTTAWINGIESTGFEGGVELFEESAGSETDREYVAAKNIMPTVPIVTCDLTALATVGFAGVAITAGTSTPGVLLFGRAISSGALPTAIGTAAHVKAAISDGILIPVSIRASHNQVAKLSMLIHAVLGTGGFSGATPIVFTASSAITAGAGALTSLFTTGPVKWTLSGGASTLCQGIQEINVSFGIQVVKEGSDGEVYPSMSGIIARDPKIEFATADTTISTIIGDGISISAFASYFRQVSQNGQRVAPATTTHVSVAGTAGMITPGSTNLVHKRSGLSSFTYTPSKNTNIITVSTSTAIPTS